MVNERILFGALNHYITKCYEGMEQYPDIHSKAICFAQAFGAANFAICLADGEPKDLERLWSISWKPLFEEKLAERG